MTDSDKFLLYRQADHVSARENPYVRDLIAFMYAEGLRAEQAAVNLLRAGEEKKAYYAAAKAEAMEDILRTMTREDPQEEKPEDDDFIDSHDPKATRRKR